MAIKSFIDDPYFDDYLNVNATGGKTPRDKNYLKVLFQPGYSVQVRELNQIQSMAQNQIDQFGRSVYKDGTPVIDGITSFNPNLYFADIDVLSNDLVSSDALLEKLKEGVIGDGANASLSNLNAEVLGFQKVYDQTGASGTVYRFYLRYLKADGTTAGPETQVFPVHASNTIKYYGDAITNGNISVLQNGDDLGTVDRVGYASGVTVQAGVFFINGNFVIVDESRMFISKHSREKEFDGTINWKVVENTITANDDSDLLDQAAGQPNETAPGAHRYQITLELKFLTDDTDIIYNTGTSLYPYVTQNNPDVISSSTSGQFVNLLNISTDKAIIPARTEYTQLDRKFAERTFDESGNYTLKPFQLDIREYLNDEAGNRGRYTATDITNFNPQIVVGANDSSGLTEGETVDTTGEAETYGESRFVVGLEPSTAYVSGYKIETTNKIEIPVEKARATATEANLQVSATIGGYVFGKINTGSTTLFDPKDAETDKADLKISSTIVGTCKLRSLEKISVDKYQLYIYDVEFADAHKDKSLADVTTINEGGTFIFEPLGTTGFTTFQIQDASEANAIIQLPYEKVKTLTVDSVKLREVFTGLTGDPITLSPPAGTFYSDAASDYVVLNGDGDTEDLAATPNLGALPNVTLDLDNAIEGSGSSGEIIAPYEDDSTPSLTVKEFATKSGGTAIEISDVVLENNDNYFYITANGLINGSNPYYDLIKVTQLQVSTDGGTNFTTIPKTDYNLDNGQRDNNYDVARIRYIGSRDYTETTHGSGNVHFKVSFEYWNWTSTGNYATVGSYDTYSEILYYKGDRLSDVIDLRQKKGVGSSGSGNVYPIDPSGIIEISNLEYYKGRVDKVVVNSIGDFSVISGAPSLEPVAPDTPPDAMALYELDVPGYTEEAGVIVSKYLDNRRYTMKDIGGLARRIKNVEYYTSLSLLEKETLDKDIFTATGDQRFKNGILVDSFFGHNIGNPSDTDYSCSIDAKKGELRPQIAMNDTLLKTTTASELNSDIIELDFTESNLIHQNLASVSESVNPYDLADWQGHVTLTPTTDEWKEVNKRPPIVINDTSAYDQFAQMAEEQNLLGTIWGEYEVAWQGTSTETRDIQIGRHDKGANAAANKAAKAALGFTGNWRPIKGKLTETFLNTTEIKEGVRRTLDYFDHTFNAGEKIVDISFVPLIRSRRIHFEAKLMKPNTRLYIFFDGKNLSNYATAGTQTVSGTYDDITHSTSLEEAVPSFTDRSLSDLQADELSGRNELISDDNGVLRGSLIIPNNDEFQFLTGERTFKLTDSSTNQDAEQTTSAQATYNARGLIESKSEQIITTRIPQINEQRLTEVRNTSVRTAIDTSKVKYYDPLAQSFIIGDYQNGVYVTGIELYFQKKHSTIPVRTHLVTVENGIPTQKVVPGTEVILNPSDVQASVDGTGTNATAANTATDFTYDQPVHLQPGVEYAIVVLSNSPEYRLWMAETGGIDNVTQEKIAKNPYAGVSFKSQNASTWTPNQNRDFKFTIKKANYSSSKTVTFTTVFNGKIVDTNITNAGSGYGSSEPAVTVSAPDIAGGTQAVITSTLTGGAVTALTIVNPGSGYTSTPTITIAAPPSGTTAQATAILNTFENSYLRLLAEQVVHPGTNIEYTYKFGNDTAREILPNRNTILPSASKEVGVVTNDTVTVVATLTTTDANLTPQLDSQRFSLLSIYNLINNPATAAAADGTTPAVIDTNDSRIGDSFSYLTTTGLEDARMSYITRSVILNSPADRLSTFLSINRPSSNTNVRVLFKLRVGDEDYNNVDWYEVKPTSPIPITPVGVFREVEFDFDPSEFTNNSDPRSSIEFNAFAVRVIFTSTDHRIIPTVKDFRAIATFS